MSKAWKVFCCATVLAPFLSSCATMRSIDRGLYSVTDAVTERDRITGRHTLSLHDRLQQIQQGNQWAEQIIAEKKASGKRLNGDYNPTAYERIKRIFFRLHQVSHVRDEQWTPVLVEEREWGAFTTGGTYFFINSGLEEDLEDDSELANVIAHEMAHSVANHAFEQISYRLANVLSRSKSVKRETFQAAFTHENEIEADRIAVLYCALAGYDPYAGARIWRRMRQKTGDDAWHVHTHPMNSERAALAQRAASQVARYYVRDQLNPDFASILASNELFSNQAGSEVEAGEGGGILSVLDAVLTTMDQREQAKLEERRQQQRIQFMEWVSQVSTLVSSAPVGPNRWRVTVHYGGNLPLTDLSFRLTVACADGNSLELISHLRGTLYPDTTFYVDFESPELNACDTEDQSVTIDYDNAREL